MFEFGNFKGGGARLTQGGGGKIDTRGGGGKIDTRGGGGGECPTPPLNTWTAPSKHSLCF